MICGFGLTLEYPFKLCHRIQNLDLVARRRPGRRVRGEHRHRLAAFQPDRRTADGSSLKLCHALCDAAAGELVDVMLDGALIAAYRLARDRQRTAAPSPPADALPAEIPRPRVDSGGRSAAEHRQPAVAEPSRDGAQDMHAKYARNSPSAI